MMRKRWLTSLILPLLLLGVAFDAASVAAGDVDKVVLANLDRYQAYLRVGQTRREIKPRKA
ncbi:hypothetical protein MNBD_ALPHA05-1958, partial [hydrothermal vent metagenome]